MRIQSLELDGITCFKNFKIEFGERRTAIFGVNGKTTILDVLAGMLSDRPRSLGQGIRRPYRTIPLASPYPLRCRLIVAAFALVDHDAPAGQDPAGDLDGTLGTTHPGHAQFPIREHDCLKTHLLAVDARTGAPAIGTKSRQSASACIVNHPPALGA